jgi:hypothetical protein
MATLSTMNNYHTRLARPLHKRLLRNGSSAAQRARRLAAGGTTSRNKSSAWKSGPFVSVLSSPFVPWNDLEIVIGDYFPEWSLTHRSYIVQHLVRFLELKVLTEEFATDQALLDPTPLVALAWQAVIHDSRLYLRTIHDIQEFHGRPTQMLKFSLPHDEFNGKVDPERLNRTQVLFQSYYCERMIESLEEADADMALEDTSAITDHFLLRCGPAGEKNTLAKTTTSAAMKKKNEKDATKKRIKGTIIWPCASGTLMDVIGDLLFFDEGEEKSQETSVVMEDIEEEEKKEAVQPYDRPEDIFQADAEGADYDSSFTLDFFHTRTFLCRQDSSSKDVVEEGGGGCRVVDSSPVFQW